ncbi:MAG: AGE family epimerase/isomerase [Bacteroidales bacterium]|nr:MAG: AGE family epimerase/isomerase [Bacteroidales bacterium]
MSDSSPIPFRWFREHFVKDILANWKNASASPDGFFHPGYDRNWNRIGDPVATLVSQSRLLYLFSNGYRIHGDPELKNIILSGAYFILEHFTDNREGGFAWSCNDKGEIRDFTKDAYGHAFLILGLAHAYRATRQRVFLEKALEALEILNRSFRDPHGGLVWKMSRDWKDEDLYRSQNPMMHLYEALLILYETVENIIQKRTIKNELRSVTEFLFNSGRITAKGLLPEIYTREWRRIKTSQGGYVSAGHLFEWAFLLSRGVSLGLPESDLEIADILLNAGLKYGYDSQMNFVRTWIDTNGNVIRDEISWWEQSEALRTIMHYMIDYNRNDLEHYFSGLLTFVKNHFLDMDKGGWYSTLNPEGNPLNTDKGSLWKLDYHQTGLCMEAIGKTPDSKISF